MIDLGLGVSLVVTAGLVWWAARAWHRRDVVDDVMSAVLVGAAVARIVHLAAEQPSGLVQPLELISLRSGAAWWPGVAGGVAWWWWRSGVGTPAARVAGLAAAVPLALVAHGSIAATCVVRDGCPGPASPVGLVPPGLSTRVLPIGLLLGLVVLGLAGFLARSRPAPVTARGASVAVVAAARVLSTATVPTLDGWGWRSGVDVAVAIVAAGVVGRQLARRHRPVAHRLPDGEPTGR